MNIALGIKKLRKKYNISQKELAILIGVKQSYLSQIESGKKNVSLNIAKKICDVLEDVSVDYLIFLSINLDNIEQEAKKDMVVELLKRIRT
jgi:transcriptional regulator with XRE-family HTH domain